MFRAATLLLILGSAVFTDAAGLSPALGAFIAGLLIAETEYRHEIHANIEPFKGLLLGLFFISIGMYMDLGEFFRQPGLILMSVLGLFAIKAAVVFVLARAFRQRSADAIEMGLGQLHRGDLPGAELALGLGQRQIGVHGAAFPL